MVFGGVYGPPFVREGDIRRDATFNDYENFCKLSQSFDALDSVGGVVCEPNDLSLDSRHLDMAYAAATLTDKFFMGNVVTAENAKDVIKMAEIIHGGRNAIVETPALVSLVNCNSPLRPRIKSSGWFFVQVIKAAPKKIKMTTLRFSKSVA